MPWVMAVVSLSMEVSLTVISLAWGAAGAHLPLFFSGQASIPGSSRGASVISGGQFQ